MRVILFSGCGHFRGDRADPIPAFVSKPFNVRPDRIFVHWDLGCLLPTATPCPFFLLFFLTWFFHLFPPLTSGACPDRIIMVLAQKQESVYGFNAVDTQQVSFSDSRDLISDTSDVIKAEADYQFVKCCQMQQYSAHHAHAVILHPRLGILYTTCFSLPLTQIFSSVNCAILEGTWAFCFFITDNRKYGDWRLHVTSRDQQHLSKSKLEQRIT